MKKKLAVAVMASLLLFQVGCFDNVELENRGFVVSIGVDKHTEESKALGIEGGKEENKFLVSVALPNMAAFSGRGGDETKKTVKQAAGKTLAQAMYFTDSFSGKKLYFGHTRLVVLGEEILKDEKLFREAIDALERNRQMNKNIIMLATRESADKILSAEVEPMVGIYVSDFYQGSHDTAAVTFEQNLDQIIRSLRSESKGTATIPLASLEKDGKELKLGGAVVMKDFKLVGYLNDLETRGYLLAFGNGEGARLNVNYDEKDVPVFVSSNKRKLYLDYSGGRLKCSVDVSAKGSVEEFYFEGQRLDENVLAHIKKSVEDEITKEVKNSFDIMQKKLKTDGFLLKDEFRKKYYNVYNEIKENWDEVYEQMEVEVKTEFEIIGTGGIG